MASLNRFEGIGNLGKDPEIRYTNDGQAIANFSIACSESWKDKQTGEKKERTEWVNIVSFGKLAEIIGEYLHKGSKVFVSGKMKTDKYEKDGQVKYSTKIVANEMIMLDSKPSQSPTQNDQANTPKQPEPAVQNDFDDDIPF